MRVPHSTASHDNREIIAVALSHYIILTPGYSLRSPTDAFVIALILDTASEPRCFPSWFDRLTGHRCHANSFRSKSKMTKIPTRHRSCSSSLSIDMATIPTLSESHTVSNMNMYPLERHRRTYCRRYSHASLEIDMPNSQLRDTR